MPPVWAMWFQSLVSAVNAGGSGSTVLPSVTLPLMDGVAALGSEGKYADGQHVHPTDTSRQAASTRLASIAALADAAGALTNDGAGNFSYVVSAGTGTVTSVSVVSANGLAGTVATATTTPAITLSTTITGLLKGNGTAISAAVAGTDYLATVATDATLTGDGTSGSPLSVVAAGGASWTEVEVDFGSTPVYSKTFTVTDASVSGASKVAVVPCGKVATGGSEDDWEWDGITFAANPSAGSFHLMAAAFPGPVAGKRKISYQVA